MVHAYFTPTAFPMIHAYPDACLPLACHIPNARRTQVLMSFDADTERQQFIECVEKLNPKAVVSEGRGWG